MTPFTTIADRIKYFRSLRRKTQVALAGEASVDYRHFQKLEAGQSDFKISTIFKLSEALDIPSCYLLQSDPFEKELAKVNLCPTSVFNQLEVGLVAWNMEGKIIFSNRQFANIIGIASEKDVMKSMSLKELSPNGQMSDRISEYLHKVSDGKIKSDFVRTQVKAVDGEIKKVFGMWNIIVSPKGNEVKGCVAAVWQEHEFLDLTILPSAKTIG